MPPSEKIRNVGPKSAAWLRQIGIRTEEDLRKFGAVEAYRRVKLAGFKPTLNLLYSMAGAEDDCHWTQLSEERKAALVLASDSITEEMNARKLAKRMGQTHAGTGMVDKALGVSEPVDSEAPAQGSSEHED
ncbi:MAG: TfoX/Sxy family protein [Lysobacterales bacterium]|nr:TfoX/Sxy family protein [Xanthomonadales bacterium]MCP5476672.1 TfoX/Sxy family protein [Rhodanobacteraceae bacterium]